MIDPHKKKYHELYWQIAGAAAMQSTAHRRKVGACLVTAQGMISVGWNGMPSGFENECEFWINQDPPLDRSRILVTKPEVIHAERNAIDKMTRQGIPTQDSIMFSTTAPCLECAKAIQGLGIRDLYYDQVQSNVDGLNFLLKCSIVTHKRKSD